MRYSETEAQPLAQGERQRQVTRPGPVVRCTFSPARAWRPAAVAPLARTLGLTGTTLTALLQQTQTQAWLLLIGVVCLVILAAVAVLGLGILTLMAKEINHRSTLSEKLQPLLDQGDLEAVTLQSRERLMTFPDDAMAHYFLGVALHRRGEFRQALVHLRRVPELQAGWDVAAMVNAIEEKLGAEERSPDLRVVKLPTGPSSPSEA